MYDYQGWLLNHQIASRAKSESDQKAMEAARRPLTQGSGAAAFDIPGYSHDHYVLEDREHLRTLNFKKNSQDNLFG